MIKDLENRFIILSMEEIRIIGAGYWRRGQKIYEERNKLY